MDTLHEDVRSVSGIYFHMVDIPDEMRDIAYILSPMDRSIKENFATLHKFIRMFALPYRVVLLEKCGLEFAGFIIYCNDEEKEELDSTMDWIAKSHSEWEVFSGQDTENLPKVIGYRIANNLFHAKRLALQGEVL